jgi:hypothetical protein
MEIILFWFYILGRKVEFAPLRTVYHPQCFCCATCKAKLFPGTAKFIDGVTDKLYCVKDIDVRGHRNKIRKFIFICRADNVASRSNCIINLFLMRFTLLGLDFIESEGIYNLFSRIPHWISSSL